MKFNIGNSLFGGLNDKNGLMICGYEWGYSKADQEKYEAGEEMVIDENAQTIFSNKSSMHGDRAFDWKYDNNIIKWFKLWGHPLSREGLGGDFEKSIIQTNWCNTEGNKIEEDVFQKLTRAEQLDNFIAHIKEFEPSIILFMGSNMIKVLQDKEVMFRFSEIMGSPKTEPNVVQKESSHKKFNITFQSFEKCEVICFPHPSGSHGISDDYIALYSDEMGKLIAEFKQIKGIS